MNDSWRIWKRVKNAWPPWYYGADHVSIDLIPADLRPVDLGEDKPNEIENNQPTKNRDETNSRKCH